MVKNHFKNPFLWVALGLTLVLTGTGIAGATHYNKFRSLTEANNSLTVANLDLTNTLARARAEKVSVGDLNDRIDLLITDNVALRADLSELKAKPISVTYVIGNTGGENTEVFVPNINDPTPEALTWIPDRHEYRTPSGLLVGEHTLNRVNSEFTATTADLNVESTTVVSRREDGSQVAHTQFTATSSLDPDALIALDTVQSEITFIDLTKRSMRVSPHINIGLSVGGNFATPPGITVGAQVGISPFAYGRTDQDNTLRFINIRGELGNQVGIANERGVFYGGIGIDPVLVNVGEFLPLLSDLFLGIGPTVFISPGVADTPTVGVGLSFGITSTI